MGVRTKRLVLVHWNEAEAQERAAFLRKAGYRVDWPGLDGGEVTRGLAKSPPDALVVDLRRLPSHGRSVAVWVRERKSLRHIPLVFVEGDAEKTARLKKALPDAVYTPWSRIRSAIRKAMAAPVSAPVVPRAPDYSGTPLARKLGIKSDSRVALVGAPRDFDRTLGGLPEGVRVTTRVNGELDVALLFCRSLSDLQRRFPAVREALAPRGGLWIAWPKKASGMQTDLDQGIVRAVGLDAGLVDNKVCAVDATWSGLRFAHRRTAKG